MHGFFAAIRARVLVFLDPTAWTIFTITLAPLLLIDPAMVKTVVQWSAIGFAFGGLLVMLSRLIFPQFDLRAFVEEARKGNDAAGHAVSGFFNFMGLALLALVLWGKA